MNSVYLFILEVLQNASFDWTKLLYGVQVNTFDLKESWIMGDTINWTVIPSEYPACQAFDLKNHINLVNNTPEIVIFSFMKIKNFGISLKIVDQRKGLNRVLRSHSADFDGSTMEMEDLSETMIKRYFITFSITKHLETDTGISCQKYPSQYFSSYQECDEKYVYNEMRNKYSIMPFWATNQLSEVTGLK